MNDSNPAILLLLLSFGAADTALAQPSGAGGGASAHFPQLADYVGNVSVCRLASLAVNFFSEIP